MPKRYLGNIITDTPSTPANNYQDTPASGVWGIYEVADLVKAGLWPTLGNLNPSKFVENIFSTYLYEGTSSALTITNGIDLAGEGGLVWLKGRSTGGSYTYGDHELFDTETEGGAAKYLNSVRADALAAGGGSLVNGGFNSDGFSLKTGAQINNRSGDTTTSWTFRKAPKFFDVVTYSGSVGSQSIAHNLGSTPGLIITKKLDSTSNWAVYHRSLGATKYILLNSTSDAQTGSTFWNDTEPTSTHFTVGTNDATNNSVRDYVAYLFAHNDGDGDFGPTGDQDIIKCGSYTGTGTAGLEINLGFEPQWFLMKRTDTAGADWFLFDVMRGFDASGNPDRVLRANTSGAESNAGPAFRPIANGVEVQGTFSSVNASGGTYIYIAIRRGPMAVPESATDVFAIDTRGSGTPDFTAGFSVDMSLFKDIANGTSSWTNSARLIQGTRLIPNTTAAEASSSFYDFDYQNGWGDSANAADTNDQTWMWRRAPNFFDVVAYTGSGTSGYATISHNLGVVPEMVWFKNRSSSTTPRGNWYVYHKDLVNSGGYVYLNSTAAEATDYSGWASSTFAPSATGFTVLKNTLHYTNENYIAYFFASVDGVSKVGSFTGNGSSTGDSQDIDCGFSSGARFVLVKAIGAAGAWFLFDTERGIVAGNDSHLSLNSQAAEDTSRDLIDPLNSGFTINYHSDWGNQLNGNGQTYIFYAIA